MLHLEKGVVRKETLTIVACLKDLSYTVCSDPVFRVIHTEPALSQDFQTSFYSKSIISICTLLDKADEHQLLEKWDWNFFFLTEMNIVLYNVWPLKHTETLGATAVFLDQWLISALLYSEEISQIYDKHN